MMRILNGSWARVLWLAVLLLTLPGCAGYRPAMLPSAADNSPRETESVVLQVGSVVKFSLADGTSVSGEVVRVTDTEFALGKVGNYGYEEQVFALSEVHDLKARKMTRGGSVLANTASVIIISFVALIVYAGLTIDWPSD